MLYKHSKNGIVYKLEAGFITIINPNGTVKIQSRKGIVEYNYISIDAFEESLVKGENFVYSIHCFKSAFGAYKGKWEDII